MQFFKTNPPNKLQPRCSAPFAHAAEGCALCPLWQPNTATGGPQLVTAGYIPWIYSKREEDPFAEHAAVTAHVAVVWAAAP